MSPVVIRAALVVVGALVATALAGGLARLGVGPGLGGASVASHGHLFALGVFGTVIALERAVALSRTVAFVAPGAGLAAAAATLLAPSGSPVTAWLFAFLAAAMALVQLAVYRRDGALHAALMLAGAGALVVATLAEAILVQRGAPAPAATFVPLWIAFFALTIAGERLELARLGPPSPLARALLVVATTLLLGAAAASLSAHPAATIPFAVAIAAIGGWILRFDLARRTVHFSGLPRFSAIGVLSGSLWLVVAGALLLLLGLPPAGPVYDAIVHAVFVGFVLSMVFAHAPIILPAVARLELRFHHALYAPLALLHVGLVLRIAGDLAASHPLRVTGAVLSTAALPLYALIGVVASRPRPKRPPHPARSR